MLDSATIIAVGDLGTIIRSTDAGVSWTVQSRVVGTRRLADVSAASASTAFAVGEEGTILRTSDSGATWILQDARTTGYLRGAWFVNETTGWIGAENGLVLHTTDGGASWMRQDTGGTLDVVRLSFFDENTGMAVATNFSRGEILRTRDGWSELDSDALGGGLLERHYLCRLQSMDCTRGFSSLAIR